MKYVVNNKGFSWFNKNKQSALALLVASTKI
jgi:hypothetical protein